MIFSIVIPCKEICPSLEALLQSCREQNLGIENFEIIVAYHQGSDEKIRSLTSKNTSFLKVMDKNVSLARNQGAQAAKGEYIYFLDDDTLLSSENHLEKLHICLNATIENSAIGGGYRDTEDSKVFSRVGNIIANLWLQSGLLNNPAPVDFKESLFLLGGNFCLRKNVFLSLGFPETISWGGEDAAFSQNFRDKSGVIFYTDELTVIHKSNPSLRKFIERSWAAGKASVFWTLPSTSKRHRVFVFLKNLTMEKTIYLPMIFLHFLILETSKVWCKLQRGSPLSRKK